MKDKTKKYPTFEEASFGNKEFETILHIFHDHRSQDPRKLTTGMNYTKMALSLGYPK